MMTISDYVEILLKKNKITRAELVRRINKLEEEAGDKTRTRKQNLTNYINGYHGWGYEFTRKVEVALELEDGFLVNMLEKPKLKETKIRYDEIMKKYKVKK